MPQANKRDSLVRLTSNEDLDVERERLRSPLESAGFFSKLSYSWINDTMALGAKRPLTEEDIIDIPASDYPSATVPVFDKHWKQELQLPVEQQQQQAPSLARAMRRTFGWRFYVSTLLHVVFTTLTFLVPYFVGMLLQFIEDEKEGKAPPVSTGYLAATGLVVTTIATSLLVHFMFYLLTRMGNSIRSTLMAVVYNKSLLLSSTSKQLGSTGKTVNLMSNDCHRVFEMAIFLNFLWLSPVVILVVLVLLYFLIGNAAFAAIFLTLIMVPLQGYMGKVIGVKKQEMLKHTDERVKVISEILAGIRVVKYYCWEKPFSERVANIRTTELSKMRTMLFAKAINLAIVYVWPVLTAFVVFAVYNATEGDLSVHIVYTSLALMNVLRFPIAIFPIALNNWVEGRVSMNRIQRFLELAELQTDYYNANPNDDEDKGKKDVVVSVQDGSFTWDTSVPPLLVDINMKIKRGHLVAIIGNVASGKSSLVAGLLGEIHRTHGRVGLTGTPSYMSSEVFIRNSTLKENVLFGLPYDETRYKKAIFAAALRPDIKMLPAGDNTEIGERGVNLSGGQKARVSVARALYRESLCDVFFFDDPFSAVDVHVGKHMFKECILSFLHGKTRIVVLNSHLHFLKYFDEIIVMGSTGDDDEQRTIVGRGSYEEMSAQFASLIHSVHTAGGGGGGGEDHDDGEQKVSDKKNNNNNNDDDDDDVKDDDGHKPALNKKEEEKSQTIEQVLAADTETEQEHKLDQVPDPGKMQREYSEESQHSTFVPSLSKKGDATTAHTAAAEVDDGDVLIVEEDRQKGAVDSSVYLSYFAAADLIGSASGTATLAFVLLMFVVGQVSRVLTDWWLSRWSDGAGDHSDNFFLAIYGTLVGITFVLILFRSVLFVSISLRSSKFLHDKLFVNLLHAPTSTFYDVTPIGRIINRFSKDLDQIDVLLPDFLMQWLQNSIHLLASVVFCCVTIPWFILVLVPISYAFYMVQEYFRKSSREVKRLEGISRSPLFSLFQETICGLSTIRAYRLGPAFTEHMNHLIKKNARLFFAHFMTSRWLALRLDGVSVCIISGVAFLCVLLRDTIDPALVGLSLIYSLVFTGLLQWTVRLSIETENNMTAVERFTHYASIQTEAPYDIPKTRPPESWPEHGVISFKNVQMRYRPTLSLVLKGISFTTSPREKLAICGRTGSGKSSLLVALYRMCEPCGGSIEIDGLDVSTLGLQSLRSKMSIIPQDPVLFSGTVRANLDPFGEATDDELWRSLDRVHLGEHIRSLPTRLEHPVAEYGENFSHGQRQLLCIARALLRHSRIIILDEATSNVDTETDQLIQSTIKTVFRDCTVLTIAHRLDTIIDSDRVLVLDKGSVAELGTPKELVQQGGIFGAMVHKAGLQISN